MFRELDVSGGKPVMVFCTIVCRNYVAQARVLAESIRREHPEAQFVVLVIDRPGGWRDFEADEPFAAIGLEDLGIQALETMKGIYAALEFSTAVKPWLLQELIARFPAADGVVYLDPDIRAYGPMLELEASLREHWAVLTPHFTESNPLDGCTPSEQSILLAGTYNLGFIGLRPGGDSERFLRWWMDRLERECIVDPAGGFFVDQRYVDLVPGLFDDVGILRHPGYNCAYWNAATRTIDHSGEGASVAGHPLRFFHFSGFNPREPDVLSKHQNRIDLAQRADLRQLTDSYATDLLRCDFDRLHAEPYPFDRAASGRKIGRSTRALYRAMVEEGFEGSLFEESGERAFVARAVVPSDRFPHLSVAEAFFWEREPGVREAFPDIDHLDAPRFAQWLRTAGHAKAAFGDVLAAEAGDSWNPESDSRPPKPRLVTGVNIVGYLNAALGVGEIARSIIRSLDVARVPVAPLSLSVPGLPATVPFLSLPAHRGLPYDQSIVCVNADMFPSVMSDLCQSEIGNRFVTGVWWWELDEVPQVARDAFPLVDQLLVGSAFIANAFKREAPVPVGHFPVPIRLGEPSPMDEISLPGGVRWPEGFVFYLSFDYNSAFERKNPLAVIEAFLAAFPEPGDASLVIKSLNADSNPQQAMLLCEAIGDRHDVVLIDGPVSQSARDSLMHAADCYVSLHRSEGLGLTMAEAMYAGKPVIATAYSGNLDFMNRENSILIDFRLVEVGGGADPYRADAKWAEPDVDQAAEAMRDIFGDTALRRSLGRKAAASIRDTNSVEAAGRAILGNLAGAV